MDLVSQWGCLSQRLIKRAIRGVSILCPSAPYARVLQTCRGAADQGALYALRIQQGAQAHQQVRKSCIHLMHGQAVDFKTKPVQITELRRLVVDV